MNPRNGSLSVAVRQTDMNLHVSLPEKGSEKDWILILKK